jgi:hypothetical protein
MNEQLGTCDRDDVPHRRFLAEDDAETACHNWRPIIASPAPRPEGRVQCKCLAWFNKAEFESHIATCEKAAPRPEPTQQLVIGDPCPTCGRKVLPKMGPGDYSCVACGLGMVEPCEHWKKMLAERPVDEDEEVEQSAPPAGAREFWAKVNRFPKDILRKLTLWDCRKLDEIIIESLEVYAAQERARADAAEREHWSKGCIVEIASVNPSVADYVKHWEGRTEKAESEVESLRSELREAQTFLQTLEPSLWLLATSGNKEAIGNFDKLKALLSRKEDKAQ